MRGVVAAAGYVPYHRLDRSEITAFLGAGGGRGTRAVASHDEDTTTMGAAAANLALRSTQARPGSLWFSTSAPAYLEKTNAAAVHAALSLPSDVDAVDFGGAVRSGIGSLRAALTGSSSASVLVVAADIRDGRPAGADEAACGDGAAAVLVAAPSHGRVVAECVGSAARTVEVIDRWRLPGDPVTSAWEERFVETVYAPAAEQALHDALADAGLGPADIDHLAVTGPNRRAVARAARLLAKVVPSADVSGATESLQASVGDTGAAQAALALCSLLETAQPGEHIAVVGLADGATSIILRATEALADYRPAAPVVDQIEAGGALDYGRFLAWRRMITVEPPNRPLPSRPSAPASWRRSGWKFGFTGSRDRTSQMVHMPPARVSEKGGALDDMVPETMAQKAGTVTGFTVDRLAYSPSPPVVVAVVDFDGGGRALLELTDVRASEVRVGMRVTPAFRRLYTADGVHNYFWKARPVFGAADEGAGT